MDLETGLALGAFLIAIVALYLSSLKRADIVVANLPGPSRASPLGAMWVDGWPTSISGHVSLVAYNVGARGGVLVDVDVFDWDDGASKSLLHVLKPQAKEHSGARLLPLTFEPGDVRLIDVRIPVSIHVSRGTPPTPEEIRNLASALADKHYLDVKLAFISLKGRSLAPWNRARVSTSEKLTRVSLSLDGLRFTMRNQGRTT